MPKSPGVYIDYKMPRNSYERAADYLAIFFLLALAYFTARHYANLPASIPTHIDAAGQPNEWGSRWTVWLLPGTGLFIFGLLWLAEKLPQLMNYPVKLTQENAQRQFLLARMFLKTLKMTMLLLFSVLQWHIIRLALGEAANFFYLLPLMLGLVFVPTGLYVILAYRAK